MQITKFLKQTAVYWGNPQNDGFGGFTYDDPVEIPVRWTDKKEKFIGKTKSLGLYEELVSRSVVMIDEDLDIGGMMSLTTLIELSSSGLPEDNESYEIKAITKTPDVRASNYVRKAWI